MAKSKTKETIIGILVTEPEIFTQDGTRVAVMTAKKSTNQNNQQRFYRIVAWKPIFIDFIEKYVSKGCRIGVSGETAYHNVIDCNGHEVCILELVVEGLEILWTPKKLNIAKPKDDGCAAS